MFSPADFNLNDLMVLVRKTMEREYAEFRQKLANLTSKLRLEMGRKLATDGEKLLNIVAEKQQLQMTTFKTNFKVSIVDVDSKLDEFEALLRDFDSEYLQLVNNRNLEQMKQLVGSIESFQKNVSEVKDNLKQILDNYLVKFMPSFIESKDMVTSLGAFSLGTVGMSQFADSLVNVRFGDRQQGCSVQNMLTSLNLSLRKNSNWRPTRNAALIGEIKPLDCFGKIVAGIRSVTSMALLDKSFLAFVHSECKISVRLESFDELTFF